MPLELKNKTNNIFYNFVYAFHMPLFFMASGWLYKEREIFSQIKNKIFTVVVPYFCFGVLTLIYWQLFERHFRNSTMSLKMAAIGLISGQYEYLDFNVHLWFLPCFFLTIVIYNALRKLTGKRITYIIAIAASLVYVIGILPSMPWGFDRVFKYIGFYALGNAAADISLQEKMKDMKNWFMRS
ncbi:MAG: acyltransferase family protein [Clostridiales bacterium]|nr:acyltransferase family protein [Clostridiales bacterium]